MARIVRTVVAMLGLAVVVSSCYAPGGAEAPGSSAGSDPAGLAVPDLPEVPVDIALSAVSRSNPSVAAKAALDLCVRPGEMSLVVGMALLPSARDVGKYMLSSGRDPELQDDTPVWLVQLKGEVTYRSGTVFHPTCMVKDGDRSIYAAYGGRQDGTTWYPPDDFVPPVLALPPLAP